MPTLPGFIARRSWLWPIAAFAVNLAILWMLSFVPSCTDAATVPRLCEATRPWSSLRPLLMIALAMAFPASIVLLGLLRMRQVWLCGIYAALAATVLLITAALFQLGYFVPGERVTSFSSGCLICDLMFMVQIAFNLGWIFAVVPVGLIRSHQRALQERQRR